MLNHVFLMEVVVGSEIEGQSNERQTNQQDIVSCVCVCCLVDEVILID